MRRTLLAAMSLAVTATTVLGGAAVAAPIPAPPTPGAATATVTATGTGTRLSGIAARRDLPRPPGRVAPAMAAAAGTVTAFVELDAPAAVEVAQAGASAGAVDAAADRIETIAQDVVPDQAAGARAGLQRISVTTNLVAGTVVRGDAEEIRALVGSPGVLAVHRMAPKRPSNKGTDGFTRAVQAWEATGQTGEGIQVGVVDSGIDYTHATLGGPGTVEAYRQAYGADGTGPVRSSLHDPAKFLGGRDLAGPDYHGDPAPHEAWRADPVEDENPIDPRPGGSETAGHGTHVAATGFGYGVGPDGSTFRGDHRELTDVSDWRVGPGTAPRAGVWAFKIFGDRGGSSYLAMEAMERAADPNGDGTFSDHVDVLNLSFGTDAAPADDPESLFVDELAALGVLTVSSVGNSGDLTDVGGSPGNARSALTVAATVGSSMTFDAVEVLDVPDPALLGTHPAQRSAAYTGSEDVTAPVTYLGDDVDGCADLTAAADRIAETILYLAWQDDADARRCGSAARWENAAAAGAVGVLIGTSRPDFSAIIAGNAEIPGAQLTAAATAALLPHLRAGTVTLRLGPGLTDTRFSPTPELADTLSSGSSRGVHGSLGVVKPDVAAPGQQISSAASGTGTGTAARTGSSMAAAHVAGIAALVRAAHPGWTPLQVKASVMNTATHDVFAQPGRSGPVFGPARVGSGRVDALDAVGNTTLAYAGEDPALVSVSFGVVPVADRPVVLRRTLTVQNTGKTAVRYRTGYAAATTTGDATITTSPAIVQVPPGRSRTVTVTLRADPATLEKELDPTSAPSYDLGVPIPRDFVALLSGRVVLTSGDTELRVPVQAAPRLVSDLTAEPVTFPAPGTAEGTLVLGGRDVDRGGWTSVAVPLQLVQTSPRLPAAGEHSSASTVRSGDVRLVGFASTAPQLEAAGRAPEDGLIGIGVVTEGEWADLGTATVPGVLTDVDADGEPDFQTLVVKLDTDDAPDRGVVDLTVAETYDITGRLVAQELVNTVAGDVDTSVFDSNVVVIPIPMRELGLERGQRPSFQVFTGSEFVSDPAGIVDLVAPFTADPYAPEYWFDAGVEDALIYPAVSGGSLAVHRTAEPTAEPSDLLVLHLHNATPERRAQVVEVAAPVTRPTTTTLAVDGDPRVGSPLTLAATVEPREATGTVTFRDGDAVLGTAPVVDGAATTSVPLGAGPHRLTAELGSDSPRWHGSTSDVVPVEVAPAGASVDLRIPDRSLGFGQAARAVVTVTATAGTPSGRVEIQAGDAVLAAAPVSTARSSATVRVDLPRDLPVGGHVLRAAFVGDGDVASATSDPVSVRVTPTAPDVSLGAQSWTVRRGSTPTVTVTVAGDRGAPAPSGEVAVVVNFRRVGTARLGPDGTAQVTLPEVRSRSLVTALYFGDAGYRPAVEMRTLRIR